MSLLDLIDDWVAKARQAHYRARGLAALCGVTDRHLRRYFEHAAGCTPQKWLNEVQLWDALPLLLLHRRRLKEISSDLDFSSASRFCARFHEHFGAAPCRFACNRRAIRALAVRSKAHPHSAGDGPSCCLSRLQATILVEIDSIN